MSREWTTYSNSLIKRNTERDRSLLTLLAMKKHNKNTKCEPGKGIRCHCTWISELRTHKEITDVERSRPFYYSKWYRCTNPDCKTTIFMEEADRVFNSNSKARDFLQSRERESQESFFRSLWYNIRKWNSLPMNKSSPRRRQRMREGDCTSF